MSFLKGRVKVLGAVASVVLSATLLGSSLIYASMTNNYRSWKQTGSSWSSMTLGASSDTVAQSGCAVTASAMLMVKSGAVTDADFNPGVLIEFLNGHGGFDANGGLIWGKLAEYAPAFQFESRLDLHGSEEQKIQRIEELLADGCSVVAQVKYGAHFVAVDSVKGNEILMLDPGSQGTSLNTTYGVASITSLRVFRTEDVKLSQDAGVSAPEDPAQDVVQEDVQNVDAPETAPEIMPTAPAEETIPAVMPETAPVAVNTEAVAETVQTTKSTQSTKSTRSTEVVIQTAPAVHTTAVTTVATKSATIPEVVIFTKPVSTTEETTCTTTVQTEILIDPIVDTPENSEIPEKPECPEMPVNPEKPENAENPEPDLNNVQIILLESAPETAPDVDANPARPTEETVPVYVPEDQAEAVLFQIKEKDLYMTVRFYILKDLDLLGEPDSTSATLQTVPAGTCLDVVEVDEEFRWGKVRYEGQEGWISLRSASLTPSN